MLPAMRIPLLAVLLVPLSLSPAVARADVAPDPDPWEACEKLMAGQQCFSEAGSGYCVEQACPDDPMAKCLYCDPNATATTSAGSTGAATTSAGSTGAVTTSAGGTAAVASSSESGTAGGSSGEGGGTTDNSSTKKDSGCGCRTDGAPQPTLLLLGLAWLLRRRRS